MRCAPLSPIRLTPYKYKTYRQAKVSDIFYVSASPSEWVLTGLDRMSVDRGGPYCMLFTGSFGSALRNGQGKIGWLVSFRFSGTVLGSCCRVSASVRNDVQPKVENRSTIGRLSRCQFYVFLFNYVENILENRLMKCTMKSWRRKRGSNGTGRDGMARNSIILKETVQWHRSQWGWAVQNHRSTHKTMYLAHPIPKHL